MNTFLALIIVGFVAQATCEKPELWKVAAGQAKSKTSAVEGIQSAFRSSHAQLSSKAEEAKAQIASLEPKCRADAEKKIRFALAESNMEVYACANITEVMSDLGSVVMDSLSLVGDVSTTIALAANITTDCHLTWNVYSYFKCYITRYETVKAMIKQDSQDLVDLNTAVMRTGSDIANLAGKCTSLEAPALELKLASVVSDARVCSKQN